MISRGAFVGADVSLGYFAEVGPRAIIGPGCTIYGCVEGQIGARTQVWRFAHVMLGAVVGEDCMIGQGVFIADVVKIGNRCRVQNHTDISRFVELADDVYIGAGVRFCNAAHFSANAEPQHNPIYIGRGASIGSNSCLIAPLRIGENAIVGANSVVTHDVPAGVTVMGAPARQK